MTRPAYSDWRTLSSTANGLTSQDIESRIRSAWATLTSGQNPDGTLITTPITS